MTFLTKGQRWSIVLHVLLLSVVMIFGTYAQAHATDFSIENIGGSIGLGTADLKQTVINIIQWVLGILALVAAVMIIYGGFVWLTAGGNEEQVTKAKSWIKNAVIGLIITLAAYSIAAYVTNAVGEITTQSTSSGASQ